MKYYPLYVLVIAFIFMLAVLSYAPISHRLTWDSAFWLLLGFILGIGATLPRFVGKNVMKYGLMDE